MKLHELQQIYPSALLQSVPTSDPDYLSLAVQTNFLWIPKSEVSLSEEKLLLSLFQEQISEESAKEHPWYASLYEHRNPPSKEGQYRMIQVRFNKQNQATRKDWNYEIQSMLPALADHFFLSENRCILIEQFTEEALPSEELEGLFLALDGDFDTYTRLFIGSFYPYYSDFTRLLQEEERLFNQAIQSDNQRKSFTLAQSVVTYFAQHKATESYMMQQLADAWFEDDFAQIIDMLWQHQGNISSAAKELFMHRNTLQYKIEKFQKQTMTNLKQMDQLFLCYLLLVAFQNK